MQPVELACVVSCFAGAAAAAGEGATCEVASSHFIPLIEGAVAEYIAKWQERSAPRGTAQQVGHLAEPGRPVQHAACGSTVLLITQLGAWQCLADGGSCSAP